MHGRKKKVRTLPASLLSRPGGHLDTTERSLSLAQGARLIHEVGCAHFPEQHKCEPEDLLPFRHCGMVLVGRIRQVKNNNILSLFCPLQFFLCLSFVFLLFVV